MTVIGSAMLDHLHRIARRLIRVRALLLGLVTLGAITAGVGLLAFEGRTGDDILMPGLILLLWAVTGLIFIDIFAHVPCLPAPDWHPWRRRLRTLWRGLHWLLLAGFLVLSLMAADVSLHIADVWLVERGK